MKSVPALGRLWPLSPLGLILRAVALTATVIALTGSGCAEDQRRVEELVQRTVGDLVKFEQIELHGPLHADVTVGSGPSLSIKGPKHLTEKLEVTQENGTLTLQLDHDDVEEEEFIQATIATPSLKRLSTAGAGAVSVKGASGPALALEAQGATKLTGTEIATESLTLKVSGAADVQLAGQSQKASYDLSGAGVIKAQNLVAEVVDVDLSGAGSVRLHATKKVSGQISGMGKVAVRGDPQARDLSTSGVGAVVYEEAAGGAR